MVTRRQFIWSGALGALVPVIDMALPPRALAAFGPYARGSGIATPGGRALPAIALTSSTTLASAPWTFGQVFKQGDVPSAQYITATSGASSFQADIRNRWPDGSAKYAVLSGISSLTANTQASVQLATTSAAPSGTNVAEPTTLANTNVTLTTGTGSYPVSGVLAINSVLGTAIGWAAGTASKVREILGPVMSEFHYYQPLSGTQVAVWWYVRAYSTGAVEIETVVENGYWQETSPGPSEADYSVTVNINGIAVFTQSNIRHYSHTRWSRVDWFSGGSAIVPAHDTAYLLGSRMVPNFGWGPTSGSSTFSTTLGSFKQTTAILTTVFPTATTYYGDLPTDGSIGAGGQSPWIGPLCQWEALYCTTADPRLYAATVGNTRQWGGFGQHFRDESTGRVPIWSSYPGKSVYIAGNTLPPTAAGGAPPAYGDGNQADCTHLPACGYLAYLIEGRWSHLEESQFTGWVGIQDQSANVSGWTGILPLSGNTTTRGLAWELREIAQACALSPTSLLGVTMPSADVAVRNSFVTSLSNTVTYFKEVYIDGTTLLPGGYSGANAIGWIGQYDHYTSVSGPFWGGSWMVTFQGMALSIAADLGIEGIGNQADLICVRNFSFQDTLATVQAGATGQGNPATTGNTQNPTWNYRRALTYARPYLTNADSSGAVPANPTFYGGGTMGGLSAALTEYVSTGNPENPSGLNASLSSAPSQALMGHESDSIVGAGNSTGTGGDTTSLGGENYGTMHLTIAALANEAGIYGAPAAFQLLTDSATYLGTSASGSTTSPPLAGAADYPQMNFLPRTQATDNVSATVVAPSWYTAIASGTWGAIPNSILGNSSAVTYGSFTDSAYSGHVWVAGTSGNPIVPWSGGVLNTVGIYDHASSTFIPGSFLCCWGGGHDDYYGNEMYCFGPLESETPAWYCPRLATDPPVQTASGGPWFDANGNPVARHTYNSLSYLPNQNWMFAAWTYAESPAALYPSPTSIAFQFNQQTPGSSSVQPWKQLANTTVEGAEPISVYDPVWNLVWATNSGGSNSAIATYNPLTNTWSAQFSSPTSGTWVDHATSAIDTKRGIWAIWDSGVINFYEVYSGGASSNGFYVPTTTGTAPSTGTYSGSIVYDPIKDCFVIWGGTGQALYTLTSPSASPYKGGTAWTWGTLSVGGATPDSEYETGTVGTFGKFQCVANAIMHGYILVSLASGNVYFFRA